MAAHPVLRKARITPVWAWGVFVVVVVGATGLVLSWAIRSPGAFGRYAGAFLAVCGLAALSIAVPRVGDILNRAFAGYWRVVGWLVAVAGPVVAASGLSDVVAGAPLAVASILLVAWFGIYCAGLVPLTTDLRRERLWASLRVLGPAPPFLYTFVLAQLAIILFATFAFLLVDHDVIRFTGGVVGGPVDLLDFFAWHLLDSFPGLDLTGTLRWDEPIGYDDSGVGVVLLAFKAIVIVPIVASYASFWRFHKQDRQRRRAAVETEAETPPA